VAETKAQLQQEQYKGIDAKYRRQQVELKTVEMGNRDLDRYCKGLEKALLAFHSTKMESINQVRSNPIIRYLFATYCSQFSV
jgi:DNA repair protein RAD50